MVSAPWLGRPLMRKTDGPAGANTLLSYFHHCNKSVYPFSSSCRDEELRSLAQLDDTGILFVKYTRGYVADSSKSNLASQVVFPALEQTLRTDA